MTSERPRITDTNMSDTGVIRGPPHCMLRRWNNSKRYSLITGLPPPKLKHVVWLHVPKAGGSSFANLLFRTACQISTPEPFIDPIYVRCIYENMCPGTFDVFDWGHAPLVLPIRSNQMAITILRNPQARTLSGFFHNLHDCPQLRAGLNMTEYRPSPGRAPFYAVFTTWHVRAYARCVTACATRMLSGHRCAPMSSLDGVKGSLMPLANATLHRFSFVGLQDQWNRTLAAFSRTFGTPLRPSDYSTVLRRSSQHTQAEASKARVAAMLREMKFVDDKLVAAAQRILTLEERGEWTPHS